MQLVGITPSVYRFLDNHLVNEILPKFHPKLQEKFSFFPLCQNPIPLQSWKDFTTFVQPIICRCPNSPVVLFFFHLRWAQITSFSGAASNAHILALKLESRIHRHFWDVLKVSTVSLSGLWPSPLLLSSAQILARKWETRSVKYLFVLLSCFRASMSDRTSGWGSDPFQTLMGRLQYGAGKRKTHFREQLRRRLSAVRPSIGPKTGTRLLKRKKLRNKESGMAPERKTRR